MKFLILSLFLISCAHKAPVAKSFFIKTEIFYDSKKLDSFEMIVKNSDQAEMVKSDLDNSHKTILRIKPNATFMNGVEGINVKLEVDHESEITAIKTTQELFVQEGKKAIFETQDAGKNLKIKLYLTEVIRKVIE